MKQIEANKALLRTSHKVRRPENADVGHCIKEPDVAHSDR